MDQSTRSAPDSHAKTLAMLERALVSKALEAVSGLRSSDLLASLDPQSSCWKTSQLSLLEDLDESLATWPRSGIMLSGIAYALPTSAQNNIATDGSLWPTPTANEDAAGRPGAGMQKMLGNHPGIRGTTPEEWSRGTLNPTWVEWLQGFPIGHTDLLPLETPSSRSGRSLSPK
jgi:hypothetical protein